MGSDTGIPSGVHTATTPDWSESSREVDVSSARWWRRLSPERVSNLPEQHDVVAINGWCGSLSLLLGSLNRLVRLHNEQEQRQGDQSERQHVIEKLPVLDS